MKLSNDQDFEVIGPIEEIKIIAVGSRIREIARLRKAFGTGRWRKLKGVACAFKMVQFSASNSTGMRRTA